MTNHAGREESMLAAVHPFRMAVTSLASPVQNILGEIAAMDDVLSDMLARPSVMDFSPFDVLSTDEGQAASSKRELHQSFSNSPEKAASGNRSADVTGDNSKARKTPLMSLRRPDTRNASRAGSAGSSVSDSEQKSHNGARRIFQNEASKRGGYVRPSKPDSGFDLIDTLADSLISRKQHTAGDRSANSRSHAQSDRHNSPFGRQSGRESSGHLLNPFQAMADQFILNGQIRSDADGYEDMSDLLINDIDSPSLSYSRDYASPHQQEAEL